MPKTTIYFLLCIIAFCKPLIAQDQEVVDKIVQALYLPYDGYYRLLEDGRIGINMAPIQAGKTIEITGEFRPGRFVSVCFNTGFVIDKMPFGEHDENYNASGNFIKLGIKNYLLNSFFPSKADIFTGLFYIGSALSEEYTNQNNISSTYDGYNNFLAIQSGINYRPANNLSILAGLQYTFLKDREKYIAEPQKFYQPGVGKWKNGHAIEPVLAIQYRIPIRLGDGIICCIDRNGRYWACRAFYHKSVKYL